MSAAAAAPRPAVLLLHGPNLNLLGERDPAQYGTTTLADIEKRVTNLGADLGADVVCAQSNHEGVLVEQVHAARSMAGIVLNPGAFAHYSIALRDAVDAVDVPCVEIHISNVHAREEFRHRSVIAPVAQGYISGFGVDGYDLALRGVLLRAAGTR
ncbi:3-dehydroquinate dehydratase [Murinocardiopsis flavida]|uniref:3-dehydroquinate dehydratase n=1 Tax=Murinocardiopsis flavida TaxID=645275 RepID=A0A2P8DL96_9ACTN|nr:type II 3-dehydroquinate dehydratase [Murinocardiopsis flavida]PSK97993.1 3-dehydroquinate dehydratase [Murinocardiopsis flavida]